MFDALKIQILLFGIVDTDTRYISVNISRYKIQDTFFVSSYVSRYLYLRYYPALPLGRPPLFHCLLLSFPFCDQTSAVELLGTRGTRAQIFKYSPPSLAKSHWVPFLVPLPLLLFVHSTYNVAAYLDAKPTGPSDKCQAEKRPSPLLSVVKLVLMSSTIIVMIFLWTSGLQVSAGHHCYPRHGRVVGRR